MNKKDTPRALLEDLLAIRTVNGRDRELDAARYLAEYFEAHGIGAQVVPIDENRGNVVTQRISGRDSSLCMLWNGHLDTVPYGSLQEWRTDPAVPQEKDGKLYARGASDMKSGLAAMVYALCHLEEPPFCDVIFAGTCDEEKDGLGAQRLVRDGAVSQADWILVGEPTGMRLGMAQKGCLWLEARVHGKTSHGAYPEEGANAAICAAAIAQEIGRYVGGHSHSLLGSATAQITRIEAGVANNMTPDDCRMVMDIRLTPGASAREVLETARGALREQQQIRPEYQASFRFLNERRAIEIPAEHPLCLALAGALRRHGYDGEATGISFFTDASILDRAGEKAVLLFGPGSPALAHQPNEYVELEKYEDAVSVLMEFAAEGIPTAEESKKAPREKNA